MSQPLAHDASGGLLFSLSLRSQVNSKRPRRLGDFEWSTLLPFAAVHLAALASFCFGLDPRALLLCGILYVVRMFGVTAGYHRYFSHRTYKTSRLFQAILAVLATSSSQKGVLWWAAHHRWHHKKSDQPGDVHSPRQDGFWYAHLGWIYHHTSGTHLERVRDLSRFWELRLLDRFWVAPPLFLAVACYVWGGAMAFTQGFCLSTCLVWHATFAINSIAHLVGRRDFATPDDSKNSLVLAILTLGEGWHNNHHHHMHSTRQGFFWWQLDLTYLVLRVLQKMGIVWQMREPPASARIRTA